MQSLNSLARAAGLRLPPDTIQAGTVPAPVALPVPTAIAGLQPSILAVLSPPEAAAVGLTLTSRLGQTPLSPLALAIARAAAAGPSGGTPRRG